MRPVAWRHGGQAGKIALVVTPEWDVGGLGAQARAANASLSVDWIAVGLNVRYYLAEPFYVFAKVEPSAYQIVASLREPSSVNSLTASSWTWGVDTAAGAGLRLFGIGDRSPVQFGLTLDFGATFGGTVGMHLVEAQVNGLPSHPGTVSLPDFNPSGFVYKLGLVVSL